MEFIKNYLLLLIKIIVVVAMGICIKVDVDSMIDFSKAHAAIRGPVKDPDFQQLGELKNELVSQERDISSLEKKVDAIEKTLGGHNQRYLEMIKQRQDIEALLRVGKMNLEKNEKRLQERFIRTTTVLKGLIVEELAREDRAEDLVARKILMQELSDRAKNLKENIEYNELLHEQIAELSSRYEDYIKVENELSTILNDLEDQKKTVAQKYQSKVQRQDEIKQRYQDLQGSIKKKVKRVFPEIAISAKFTAPLDHTHVELKDKGKGLFFKFVGRQPVKSAADGVVVFSGELSTFGKLIMVDHGEGVRSIMLGQLRPTVAKGVKVVRGDILGYTDDVLAADAKVYFEVRKGSKVQNTLNLMDDAFKKNYKI